MYYKKNFRPIKKDSIYNYISIQIFGNSSEGICYIFLLGTATTMAGNFPATGQTSCYSVEGNLMPCKDTGQDGELQAGNELKYKDNNKGAIIDLNTLLVWEKKSTDNGIHDKDNTTVGRRQTRSCSGRENQRTVDPLPSRCSD